MTRHRNVFLPIISGRRNHIDEMSAQTVQDGPPPGGYPKIDYRRALPRRGPSGFVMWTAAVSVFTFGMALMIRGREIEK